MLTKTQYASPLGGLILLSDERGLLGLWFEDQKYLGAGYDLATIPEKTSTVAGQLVTWLDEYFKGNAPSSDTLPLNPQVTAYRQRVLQVLRQVPYGQTITYRELAQRLSAQGATTSPRAIGGAVGHNPLSIVIPCHRVVGSDGSLTGYAGGIERKIALLKLEGVDVSLLK